MNNLSKKKTLIYIIVILLVFIISLGISYAYFSAESNVEGEPNTQEVFVGTLSVKYTDNLEINFGNAFPGNFIEKVVSVENTGTFDAHYELGWAYLLNEFRNNELLISAECKNFINGVESGTCENIESAPIQAVAGAIKSNIALPINSKHEYTIKIEFIETSSEQNYNQGVAFSGVINVNNSNNIFNLYGTVLNRSNIPLSNSTIRFNNNYTVTTDSSGKFSIEGLESGNYAVTIVDNVNQMTIEDTLHIITGDTLTSQNNVITTTIDTDELYTRIIIGEDGIEEYEVSDSEFYDYGTVAEANINNLVEDYYNNRIYLNGELASCYDPINSNGNIQCNAFYVPKNNVLTENDYISRYGTRINQQQNSGSRANIYAGTNNISLTSNIPPDYTVEVFIYGSNYVSSSNISNFKLLINGSYYSLQESVTNGYIKPIVLMYSGEASASYLYPTFQNIYNGSTGTGSFSRGTIVFMSNTEITGIRLYSSSTFANSLDKDGLDIWMISTDQYRLTLNPY